MPGVHDLDTQGDKPRRGKVAVDKARPALFLLLGHLGIAIARQIHEICPAVDFEEVDVGGLSGGLPNPGQILPEQQLMQQLNWQRDRKIKEKQL